MTTQVGLQQCLGTGHEPEWGEHWMWQTSLCYTKMAFILLTTCNAGYIALKHEQSKLRIQPYLVTR